MLQQFGSDPQRPQPSPDEIMRLARMVLDGDGPTLTDEEIEVADYVADLCGEPRAASRLAYQVTILYTGMRPDPARLRRTIDEHNKPARAEEGDERDAEFTRELRDFFGEEG